MSQESHPQPAGLNITPDDQLRDVAIHAHADLQVGMKMLHCGNTEAAWQYIKKGYDRLGEGLKYAG